MILWTDEATADLAGHIAWIHGHNPHAAERIAEDVLAAIRLLEAYPLAGRAGRRDGTRELVAAPKRYLVVYQVTDAEVVILRVLHGSQLWPSAGS